MAIVQPNFKTSTSFRIRLFHLLSWLFIVIVIIIIIIPFVITIIINIVIIIDCSISIGFYLCCYVLYAHKLPCLVVTVYITGRKTFSKLLLKMSEKIVAYSVHCLWGQLLSNSDISHSCALSPAPHQLLTNVLLPTMIASFS